MAGHCKSLPRRKATRTITTFPVKHRPRVRPVVAFVTHFLPRQWEGSSTYVLAVLGELARAGFAIEYICTRPILRGSPWYVVPKILRDTTRFTVPGSFRFGRHIINYSVYKRRLRALLLLPLTALRAVLPRAGWVRYRTTVQSKVIVPHFISGMAAVTTRLSSLQPDVVMADQTTMSPILSFAPHRSLKAVLVRDVMSSRAASFAKVGIGAKAPHLTAQQEARLLSEADLLVAIQEDEARTLRFYCPGVDVVTVPLPVVLKQPLLPQIQSRLVYIGGRHEQNAQALRWFIQDVWPTVKRSVPKVSLTVCGDVCTYFLHDHYPGITFKGRVNDLAPEYSAAQLCIVPYLAGSGLKIKLVEALSFTRACVSTSIGMQGLSSLNGKCVIQADTPVEFAAAVISVLTDDTLRQRMENEAAKAVNELFSPEVACAPLVKRLRSHAPI